VAAAFSWRASSAALSSSGARIADNAVSLTGTKAFVMMDIAIVSAPMLAVVRPSLVSQAPSGAAVLVTGTTVIGTYVITAVSNAVN
jgi:hypothetical protein